jgi:tetratricopeptide (TPR) repeat protein
MLRFLSLIVCAALLAAFPAVAQSSNPILEQYRAYAAALQSGDLATAETAAAQAYQISVARDGDGGRTAVLALNLATTRLLRGDATGAREPATHAERLSATPSAGIDPLTAKLVLGRAELGARETSPSLAAIGARRLREALAATEGRTDLNGEIYPAATALAAWYFSENNFDESKEAWRVAQRTADASNGDPQLARAYAGIGVTAAIVMSTAGRRMREGEVEEAANAIDTAIRVYERRVSVGPQGAPLNPLQNAYAQAMAWRAALIARLRSEDIEIPAPIAMNRTYEIGEAPDGRPSCLMDFAEQPSIRYPDRMAYRSGVGSVIVHIRTDEYGAVIHRQVVAAVGQRFVNSVDQIDSDWRMVRRAGSEDNCRLSRSWFASVVFMIGS